MQSKTEDQVMREISAKLGKLIMEMSAYVRECRAGKAADGEASSPLYDALYGYMRASRNVEQAIESLTMKMMHEQCKKIEESLGVEPGELSVEDYNKNVA